jgi:sialate O-acetylesterase
MNAGLTNTSLIGLSMLAGLALTIGSPAGAASQNAAPLPFLSPIFGDNMVLQRGKPNPIWG